jgi:PKD-like domain
MKIGLISIIICLSFHGISQSIIALTDDFSLYEINLDNCEARHISTHDFDYFDIAALSNGDLYGITYQGNLYKMDTINTLDELVFSFPGVGSVYNGMVASKEGVIYASTASGILSSYNTLTEEYLYLGQMISGTAGDLTFYNDDLYCAGVSEDDYNQLIKVNLNSLGNSIILIDDIPTTSDIFSSSGIFGLTTIVTNCTSPTTYAAYAFGSIELTRMYAINYELNELENICDVELTIYGTTAFTEPYNSDLSDAITIDSMFLDLPDCQMANGSIAINCSGNGPMLYSLNNQDFSENNTFGNLAEQMLSIHMTDLAGCTRDTLIDLTAPMSEPTYAASNTCDSLLVGNFEFLLYDQEGCDSIISVNNTFLPIPDAPMIPAELVIQQNELPFQINIPEISTAASYSWQVPEGVSILSGANSTTITVDWSALSVGGLVCVSAINECGNSPVSCLEVIVNLESALEELEGKGYLAFPNPTTGLLQIIFPSAIEGSYEIRDLTGKLLFLEGVLHQKTAVHLNNQPQGLYLLLLKTGEGMWIERVVKM